MEIKLKQQTPLIHFQHDQEGATLRATEVKAKLDKFILLKKERKPPAHWIQNKEKSDQIALAYKVKIIAPNPETPKEIPDGYPGFFGNMLTIEEKREGKKPLQFVLHQFVKVKIDSSNSSLIIERDSSITFS